MTENANKNNAECMCFLLRVEQFISCRQCSGSMIRQDCPHQSNHHSCSVPNALDLVRVHGIMYFKVNATSEISSTTSDNHWCDINHIGKIYSI